jgi:SPP1 gp7 family putative phage head morphogenesis protein
MSIFDAWLRKPITQTANIFWGNRGSYGKGKVESAKSFWKKQYGEDHPFDMELVERAYKQVPIIHSAINKTVDQITSSDFHIKSDNPQIEISGQEFLNRIGFDLLIKTIAKDLMIYGNAFVEKVGNFDDFKCLSPKYMFVKRDEYGKVEGYTQVMSNIGKPVDFKTHEMVHFKYNVVGDSAYGYSIIAPILKTIEHKLNMEKIMVKLMERKANAPYWAKLGNEQQPAKDDDITAFANDLQYINERTEFVTSHNVEMSVLDVASKLPNFEEINKHIENQIVYGTEVPLVLLGQGSIPEGLASVQLEAFDRRVHSIRLLIEAVVEEEILTPYFNAQGLVGTVEFEFEPQTQNDKWKDVMQLTALVNIPEFKNPVLRKISRLLEIDLEVQNNPFAPQPIVDNNPMTNTNPFAPKNPFEQKVNPFAPKQNNPFEPKPKPNPFIKSDCSCEIHEEVKEDYTIDEWTNRKNAGLLPQIINYLKKRFNPKEDEFKKSPDIVDLSDTKLNKVRDALIDAFQKGSTLNQFARNIEPVVEDKDRAMVIARTETVKASAEAYLDRCIEDGISTVRFVAIGDNKLCPTCNDLNGRIFNIHDARGKIPLHPNCRCSWAGIFNL